MALLRMRPAAYFLVLAACLLGGPVCAQAPASTGGGPKAMSGATTGSPRSGAPAIQDPDEAVASARHLLARVFPDHSGNFEFHWIPPDSGRDVFQVEAAKGRVTVRGNSGVSMGAGLYWYLTRQCRAHLSWTGDQLDLPHPLPDLARPERRVSPFRWRYAFNFVTYGYETVWWDWPGWERMIDWLALHGVNMPLSATGHEAVWQAAAKRLGLEDEESRAFLPGPPYLPFQWMGCLEGWDGPLDQDWIDRRRDLQIRILDRQRSLGMKPVLPASAGHVPEDWLGPLGEMASDRGDPGPAQAHSLQWHEFSTRWIYPGRPEARLLQKILLEEQRRLYGTDHLYAADFFIEMLPPRDLSRVGADFVSGLQECDPRAVWVLQTWPLYNQRGYWTPERVDGLLQGVPDSSLVLLDLYCDVAPTWKHYDGFQGRPWLWCIVQNFGDRVQLHGNLPRIQGDLAQARTDSLAGGLSGIGIAAEGLDVNPLVYDFLFDQAWPPVEPPEDWIVQYARSRYGQACNPAEEAWRLLLGSVYSQPVARDAAMGIRPELRYGSRPDPLLFPFGETDLLLAWEKLLQSAPELGERETYRFDLVNLTRQVLSTLSDPFLQESLWVYHDGDQKRFREAAAAYLRLLEDLDRLLASEDRFGLEPWLDQARRWGSGPEAGSRYEQSARRLVSQWGGPGSEIHDYSRREWSGLISGLYIPRWRLFFEHLERALPKETGPGFDRDVYLREVLDLESAWIEHGATGGDGSDPAETMGQPDRGDVSPSALSEAGRPPPSVASLPETTEAGQPPPSVASLPETTEAGRTLAPVAFSRQIAAAVQIYRSYFPLYCRPLLPDLATGRPVRASSSLEGRGPERATAIGAMNSRSGWWAGPAPQWIEIDLERERRIEGIHLYFGWKDGDAYQYTIETSMDGETWAMMVNESGNSTPASPRGKLYMFDSAQSAGLEETDSLHSSDGRPASEETADASVPARPPASNQTPDDPVAAGVVSGDTGTVSPRPLPGPARGRFLRLTVLGSSAHDLVQLARIKVYGP